MQVFYKDKHGILYQGDSRYLIRKFADCSVQMLHVDPPWSYNRMHQHPFSVYGRFKLLSDLGIRLVLHHCYKKLQHDKHGYVWVTNPRIFETQKVYLQPLMQYKGLVIWHKHNKKQDTTFMGTGNYYRGSFEGCVLLVKGKFKGYKNNIRNVITDNLVAHSVKSVKVLRQLLEMSTVPGDVVLDPFCGGKGSILPICKQMGRHYIGVEIDKEKCEQLVEKLKV